VACSPRCVSISRWPDNLKGNVEAGARSLKRLLARYGENLALALGVYSAGPARADEPGRGYFFAAGSGPTRKTVMFWSTTGVRGRSPASRGTRAILPTRFMPSTTCPKIVC